MAAISILSFIAAWNEFMGPLIYLRIRRSFRCRWAFMAAGFDGRSPEADYSWSVIMAGNVLMIVPVIAGFFLFRTSCRG